MSHFSRQISTDDDRQFHHLDVPENGGVFVLRGDTTVRIPPGCVYGERATLSVAAGKLHKSRIPHGAVFSDVITVTCSAEQLWRPVYVTFSHMADTGAMTSQLLVSTCAALEQGAWKPVRDVSSCDVSSTCAVDVNHLLTQNTVIVELRQFDTVSFVLLGQGELRKFSLSVYANYLPPEVSTGPHPRLALTALFSDSLVKKLHDHAKTIKAGKHVGDMCVSMTTDKQVDMCISVKQAPLLWGNDVTVTYSETFAVDDLIRRSVPSRRCVLPWEDLKVSRLGFDISLSQAGTELGTVSIKDLYLKDVEKHRQPNGNSVAADEKFYREPIDLYGRVHERLREAPHEMSDLAAAFHVVAEPEVAQKDTGLVTALFLSAMFTTNDIERVLRKSSKSFHSWLMSVIYQT